MIVIHNMLEVVSNDTVPETVIELLDDNGIVVYQAFPDESPVDLEYVEYYLRNGYAISGYFYPPNVYPVSGETKYTPKASFDTFDEVYRLISYFKPAFS